MKITTKILAKQPFLRGMSKSQLEVLMEDAMFDEFPAGEVIFEEGAPANWFYLVLSGEVALESRSRRANHGRSPIRMQTLGPARTLTPVTTIFFYGSRLREQCEQDHELGYELMKRTAETSVKRLQVTRQRLLELEEDLGSLKVVHPPAAAPVVLATKRQPTIRQRHGRKWER
jgi:CRP-like cAMP-binding protein